VEGIEYAETYRFQAKKKQTKGMTQRYPKTQTSTGVGTEKKFKITSGIICTYFRLSGGRRGEVTRAWHLFKKVRGRGWRTKGNSKKFKIVDRENPWNRSIRRNQGEGLDYRKGKGKFLYRNLGVKRRWQVKEER